MKFGLDSAMPFGDAVAASALPRLFSFTRDRLYYERAEGILRAFRESMAQNAYGRSAG